MISFSSFISEGVNDPAIFKAVFLAGGPGSGKSFVVGKTALTALGFRVVNSDEVFERALKKAGMSATPENIYSDKGQSIRNVAKATTQKRLDLYLMGRLGIVIDGTGKDYEKISKQANQLRDLGYDVAMIFVNTDLDTAKKRNRQRDRSLPDDQVEDMWNGVQRNLGKFQNFFRQKMFIVDNSEGSNFEKAVLSTYKQISKWSKDKPASHAAVKWIDAQRQMQEALAILEQADGEKDVEITMKQMKDFEKFVDRMFEKYKIDFDFTKHFGDRMNDDRNTPKIKLKELADLIKKIYAKHGNPLKGKAGAEVVVKDLQSDLNMPIAIEYVPSTDEINVVAKTIMRKKNFSTPNQIVKY